MVEFYIRSMCDGALICCGGVSVLSCPVLSYTVLWRLVACLCPLIGDALIALLSLCQLAGATVVGIGILIEKLFQNGRENIIQALPHTCDIPIYVLACITHMSPP